MFRIHKQSFIFYPPRGFRPLITKKRISAITITAPIMTPITTPLAVGFVGVVVVVAVVLVLFVAVPAAVEVVVLVLDKAAKTAKVLKWSTEAVIV
jgi:hypothetical protein